MYQTRDLHIIPLQALNNGTFDANWEIGKAFIDEQKMEDVHDANLVVSVHFVKQLNVYTLSLKIKGTVSVPCDRCLEVFKLPLKISQEFLVKVGNKENELSEDDNVMVITPDEIEISLSPTIYEMILFALPLKKVHPNEKDCNADVVAYLKHETEAKKEEKTDPRWDSLKYMFKN